MARMEPPATRPLPDTRGIGKRYWQGGREEILYLPLCRVCRESFWYPRTHCPSCGSDQLSWIESSGEGVVHTFTVVRRATDPYFKGKEPYVVAVIELSEGPRVITNIVGCETSEVHVDMPVTVTFEDAGEDLSIPLFRPAKGGTG